MLVLLSTVSWTVEKHLCMGRVMDVAFFHEADNCGMEEAMAAMGYDEEAKHCCDNESFVIKGQDDLNLTWEELTVSTQVFLSTFVYTYFHLEGFSEEQTNLSKEYPPPLLVQDLTILHEVFLI